MGSTGFSSSRTWRHENPFGMRILNLKTLRIRGFSKQPGGEGRSKRSLRKTESNPWRVQWFSWAKSSQDSDFDRRAIAMVGTRFFFWRNSPDEFGKNLWWNSSSGFEPFSRNVFFVRERLFLGEWFFFIFFQVDEIWCFTYIDLWHGNDVYLIRDSPPMFLRNEMIWIEPISKFRGRNEFETYPNDTELEGSFSFVRESWSVKCLFERHFAGDSTHNLVRVTGEAPFWPMIN